MIASSSSFSMGTLLFWIRHDGDEAFGNPKISIEVIGLGTTVRDAVHSTLFAASFETEKPYPAAIENISTAAHRITSSPNHAFGCSGARPLITRSTNLGETDGGTCRNSCSRPMICSDLTKRRQAGQANRCCSNSAGSGEF
jgi:hypothetical protein